MPRRIAVVPHTHWDREWYEPFDAFRLRLVGVLDDLLALLERDPSYRHFLLDGQMAMIDDYLEVRPGAHRRIRRLACAGRLTVGPWYVLADEFLVSGETLVRNLQLGIERAAAFGGAMEVGYLPDMFGHIAQMPQILSLAGFEHAVVWRGVPSAIDRTAFWWEAPDGSTVRAEYLPVGYGNGAAVPKDSEALIGRVRDHLRELEAFHPEPLLFMNGTDHQAPQPWLGAVLAQANRSQDDLTFCLSSLPAYLADAPTADLPRWRGELRSGARANLLMGVTSNRVDVKQAAAATERALERRAEPYLALFGNPSAASEALLAQAWKLVVTNAAHDSICACSVDEVVEAVLGRFSRSRTIADGIAASALTELSQTLAQPGSIAVNPSADDRTGLVEVVVVGEHAPPHTQVLSIPSGVLGIPTGAGTLTLDATTVRTVLSLLPAGTRIDDDTWIQAVTVHEDEGGIDVLIALGPHPDPEADVTGARQDLYTRLGARPDAPVRIRLDQPPVHRVLALTGPVPGLGWSQVTPVAPQHPVTANVPDTDGGPVVLSNGLATVALDPTTATFAVDGIPGFGRLVDQGDYGDAYNYSPPARDSIVDSPDSGSVALIEPGPLRATASITASYSWPTHVEAAAQQRAGHRTVTVRTTVELRADDPVVRVQTTFVNQCADHRVRLHFPLPQRAATSTAECAFATVERGLEAEGRVEEHPLATFPSRRFVQAGGLTLVHDGLNEYELIDIVEPGSEHSQVAPSGSTEAMGAATLAVTVLRATGMLSRLGATYRPLPAGPLTEVPGQQMLGKIITARYGLCVGNVDPYQMVESVLLPFDVVVSAGGGWREAHGQALSISGARVSALRRYPGGTEVRVFNPTAAPVSVGIGSRAGWLVDLRGRPLAPVDSCFDLRPFAIATVHLPDEPGTPPGTR